MIRAQEIKSIARQLGISNNHIIEKDYVLSHILNVIYGSPILSQCFVFKGGTSLRKCWFEDYRFSEDLDFTLIDNRLMNEITLKSELKNIKNPLSEHGIIVGEIEIEQVRDDYNEEAFAVKIPYTAVFKSPPILPKIKLDITRYEKVLLPIMMRSIIHQYSDREIISNNAVCYSIEEILAEKLRALIQRGYPRDFFDVYSILIKSSIDKSIVSKIFSEKCKLKNVKYSSSADFFTDTRIANAKIAWRNSLGHLLVDLPDFELVIAKLKTEIPLLLRK